MSLVNMTSRFFRTGLTALLVGLVASTAACSADSGGEDTAGTEDDLTSITARSRTLSFVGTVYVAPGSSDATILSAVRSQSQTAFGALRTSNVAVNSRELKDVDPRSFIKRTVKMVDPATPAAPKDMLEVKYTYKDNAVVDAKYASRTALPLAIMNPGYAAQTQRILTECTRNDSEAQEFSSSIWYVFEPSVASCGTAMKAEQDKVDAERARLTEPTKQVTKAEVERLYLPITATLGADKTNRGASYPEYARLYKGGVKPNTLVVSLVYGLIDHDHSAGYSNDFNWGELMTNLSEVINESDGWKVVPGGPDNVDLAHFTLASGKKIDNASIKDLTNLHGGTDALGLAYADKQDLDKQLADRVFRKWVTVERTVSVKIGSEAPQNAAIQMLFYFGSESDQAPHKYAIKNSDVFLYNGHSYIGFGPLDPSRFTAADFPTSYQLFWVDGCVSYNYYEKDYIPLKQGGTKNLDLITNAIEAPSWRSGYAMGRFTATLLNGKGASYKDLLAAAKDTDPLRVVDGELDNTYKPSSTPITVTTR
ncbi:MAG: hypothetical protein JWO86_3613 [Myxococcaceae bacterium]|nr:hypothetical protein [Myxococcaceae bacterium]